MEAIEAINKSQGNGPSSARSLHALVGKLRKTIGSLDNIPKSGFNEHSRYHYIQLDKIAATAREALNKAGLVLIGDVEEYQILPIETSGGKSAWSAQVTMRYILTDGTTDLEFHIPGCGMDTGDKALPKALSNSRKYAILTLCNLGGEDPEKETQETQPKAAPSHNQEQPRDIKLCTSKQINAIFALSRAIGWSEGQLEDLLRNDHGVTQPKSLTREQASQVISLLQNPQ